MTLLLLLTASGASPSLAEPELAWDSERVIALASDLEQTLAAALEQAEDATAQRTALQQRKRDAAVTEIRRVHAATREYLARLREGWSRGDSAFFFRQLQRMVDSALQTAQDAVPTGAAADSLSRALELLGELSRFYDAA